MYNHMFWDVVYLSNLPSLRESLLGDLTEYISAEILFRKYLSNDQLDKTE